MTERTVYKAYKCRLYPKPEQAAYFRRVFGCCRLVYNHFLEVRITAYEERKTDPEVRVPSHFDMCRMLTDFKRERTDADGHAFLKDVDSTALVYELRHLDDAFHQFYRRVRQGARNVGFPRFKKRGDRDSATVTFKRLEDMRPNKMRFAKVGWVNAKVWREVEGTPVSCTVSADAAGRWWASVLCKGVPARELPPSDSVAVVRLGGAPAGGASEAPADVGPASREARERRRLERERRRLARRRAPGNGRRASARWLRQKERVARLEARGRDRMRAEAHRLTSALVRENGTVVVEAPSGPRSAADAELVRQLRYKCAWAGRELIEE